MKKIFYILVLTLLCLNLNAQTSGGPDLYGYTWKNSSHTVSPPTYSWFDITSIGTQVTGLMDDNYVGPFSCTGFQFYWYPVTEFWIGSNGFISFTGQNIASPFPVSVPLSSGANDWIAPLLGDLNFTGTGNPAACYYYANADTICVSFIGVPFWVNSVSGYTGSNTFQIILNKVDKSITYNYLSTSSGTVTLPIDNVVGIENNTGNLGLAARIDLLPTSLSTYKFYYPSTVTYAVTDGGVNWNNNDKNAGIFIPTQSSPLSLKTNIKNFGNQSLSSFSVMDTVYNATGTPITSGTATVPALTMGMDTTVTLSNTFVASIAGIYSFNTWISGITGDMVASNDSLQQEIIAVDTSSSTVTLDYSDGVRDGDLGWNGGNGGIAIYIEPPFYPAKILSSRFNIYSNATSPVGFHAIIYDDDGINGIGGTVLDSVYVPPANIILTQYTVVPTQSSNIVIDSGGVYLLWLMDSASIRIATDETPPISRRTYEVLSGGWAGYRSLQTEDFLMGLNVEKSPPIADFNFDNTNMPTIVYTDQSAGLPITWHWDFDNSSATSTLQNPSYTYTTSGTYNVCLKVTNQNGSDSICKPVIVDIPPVANFGFDDSGSPTIVFSDSSTGPPTTWFWDFDNANVTSIHQDTTYTYPKNGTFDVCLKVTNSVGSDSICKSVIINTVLPTANFSYDTTYMPIIAFTDKSSVSPTSWLWDFDDLGATSTMQDPVHAFTTNGIHNVCLIATNFVGSSTAYCKNININGVGINEKFSLNQISVYPNPFSDKTIIKILSTKHYSDISMKCVDMMGKRIEVSYIVKDNKIELSRNELSKGTYFFELFDKDEKIGNGKFLVQ